MQSFIEPLYKSKEKIIFGWKPEPGNVAVYYKMYVSRVNLASSMVTPVYTQIAPQVSQSPGSVGKVTHTAEIIDVRTALSLSSVTDFSNLVLYWAITYVNSAGSESSIALSTIVEVPPVGVTVKYMKDDPTINRHPYVFSESDQKWLKTMGTSSGAMITSASGFYADNITTDYVYDGTDVSSMRVYSSDATTSGSPAKLTTFTYVGGKLTKSVTVDSTVV